MKQSESPAPGRWHRLDNTANLFPVITSKRATNVYRISVNLHENVEPELLQRAVETVLPWFAAFRVRLRRGLFWHYLEANGETPLIHQEDDYPCRYIDPAQNNQFLFQFSYYEKRINVECFHVLSDGTGSLAFLRAVLCQYLMLAHPAAFSRQDKEHRWFAGHAADTEDSYVANYIPTKKAKYNEGRAYRIRGEKSLLGTVGVVHAHIDLPGLLAHCRGMGASINQYLTACIGWALFVNFGGKGQKHPVNIFTPVNLRNLFDSTTSLNFFSNVFVTVPLNDPSLTFEEILASVKKQYAEKVNKQYMLERISYTVGSGYNPWLRPVPLPLKILALRTIYEVNAKSSTMGFSNMGRMDLPDIFRPYVDGASLMLSTTPREPFKCTAISYGDVLTFTTTSLLRSVALQKTIIRKLTEDGLDVTIETNGVDYGSL